MTVFIHTRNVNSRTAATLLATLYTESKFAISIVVACFGRDVCIHNWEDAPRIRRRLHLPAAGFRVMHDAMYTYDIQARASASLP